MTAIHYPPGGNIWIDLQSPTDLRGLPRYFRHDFYVPNVAHAEWTAQVYGPQLFGVLPASGSSGWPDIYPFDSDSDDVFDEWTDTFSGPPSLQYDLTADEWTTIEFLAVASTGTNRLAVGGTEVTWTSTYAVNPKWFFVLHGDVSYTEEIYGGVIQIGTAWQTADLFEFDPATETQASFDALETAGRWYTEGGGPGGSGDQPYIGDGPAEVTPPTTTFTKIKFGDGLTVTDEGGGVIRVDAVGT